MSMLESLREARTFLFKLFDCDAEVHAFALYQHSPAVLIVRLILRCEFEPGNSTLT